MFSAKKLLISTIQKYLLLLTECKITKNSIFKSSIVVQVLYVFMYFHATTYLSASEVRLGFT